MRCDLTPGTYSCVAHCKTSHFCAHPPNKGWRVNKIFYILGEGKIIGTAAVYRYKSPETCTLAREY